MDEVVKEDLSKINEIDAAHAASLIDTILSFLANAQQDFQSQLASFAESSGVSASILKPLVKALIIFFQDCLKEGLNKDKIAEKCNLHNITSSLSAIIADTWTKKSVELTSSLISKTVSANQLIDMDWTFGVTAASDDCDQVGKTFLQLKLTVDEGNVTPKNVFVELSLEQFYSMLGNLEKVKSHIDYVMG